MIMNQRLSQMRKDVDTRSNTDTADGGEENAKEVVKLRRWTRSRPVVAGGDKETFQSANQSFTLLRNRIPKTSNGQRSFSYRGVTVWNQLSLEIKTAPSLAAFKTKLKSFLKDQRG